MATKSSSIFRHGTNRGLIDTNASLLSKYKQDLVNEIQRAFALIKRGDFNKSNDVIRDFIGDKSKSSEILSSNDFLTFFHTTLYEYASNLYNYFLIERIKPNSMVFHDVFETIFEIYTSIFLHYSLYSRLLNIKNLTPPLPGTTLPSRYFLVLLNNQKIFEHAQKAATIYEEGSQYFSYIPRQRYIEKALYFYDVAQQKLSMINAFNPLKINSILLLEFKKRISVLIGKAQEISKKGETKSNMEESVAKMRASASKKKLDLQSVDSINISKIDIPIFQKSPTEDEPLPPVSEAVLHEFRYLRDRITKILETDKKDKNIISELNNLLLKLEKILQDEAAKRSLDAFGFVSENIRVVRERLAFLETKETKEDYKKNKNEESLGVIAGLDRGPAVDIERDLRDPSSRTTKSIRVVKKRKPKRKRKTQNKSKDKVNKSELTVKRVLQKFPVISEAEQAYLDALKLFNTPDYLKSFDLLTHAVQLASENDEALVLAKSYYALADYYRVDADHTVTKDLKLSLLRFAERNATSAVDVCTKLKDKGITPKDFEELLQESSALLKRLKTKISYLLRPNLIRIPQEIKESSESQSQDADNTKRVLKVTPVSPDKQTLGGKPGKSLTLSLSNSVSPLSISGDSTVSVSPKLNISSDSSVSPQLDATDKDEDINGSPETEENKLKLDMASLEQREKMSGKTDMTSLDNDKVPKKFECKPIIYDAKELFDKYSINLSDIIKRLPKPIIQIMQHFHLKHPPASHLKGKIRLAIRDIIIKPDQKPNDWDFTTQIPYQKLIELYRNMPDSEFHQGKLGSISLVTLFKISGLDRPVDFTQFHCYLKNQCSSILNKETLVDSLHEDDPYTKDSSVNSIFLELDEEGLNWRVVDLSGNGLNDLIHHHYIRANGHPLESFLRDPVRMLRCIYTMAKLSTSDRPFTLEPATRENLCFLMDSKDRFTCFSARNVHFQLLVLMVKVLKMPAWQRKICLNELKTRKLLDIIVNCLEIGFRQNAQFPFAEAYADATEVGFNFVFEWMMIHEDPNQVNYNGELALNLAILNYDLCGVMMLLSAGANPELEDVRHFNAFRCISCLEDLNYQNILCVALNQASICLQEKKILSLFLKLLSGEVLGDKLSAADKLCIPGLSNSRKLLDSNCSDGFLGWTFPQYDGQHENQVQKPDSSSSKGGIKFLKLPV